MKEIRSRENGTYREAVKLLQKKHRDREGRFLVEGEKLVKEAALGGKACQLFLRREVAEAQERAWIGEIPCAILIEPLFRRLVQTDHDQGILCVVKRSEENAEERIQKHGGHVVILDRLQDPGNIGTIIRTAEAAGYAGVLTVTGTGDPYSPKAVRAAAGAILRMPLMAMGDAKKVIEWARKTHRRLTVTSVNQATPMEELCGEDPLALVIGNEGNGIAPDFDQAADQRIHIPMEGETESLNAAVAAGILMYHSRRKG